MARMIAARLLILPLLAGTAAVAQSPDTHRRVTDPIELAEQGFGADTELWLLKSVALDQRPLDERLAEREAEAAVNLRDERWFSVQASDFHVLSSQSGYNTLGELAFILTGSDSRFAFASLELPEGRRLRWLDVWAFDNRSNDQLIVSLMRFCLPIGGTGTTPTVTEIGRVETGISFAGGAFFGSAALPEPLSWVRNFRCSYGIRLEFSSLGLLANVALLRARLE